MEGHPLHQIEFEVERHLNDKIRFVHCAPINSDFQEFIMDKFEEKVR